KDRAASCAASKRLGCTSVAFIDKDTSTTNITVARFRGTCSSAVGPARATVNRINDTINSTADTCLVQPCRRGATRSNNSRFEKRIVRFRRIRRIRRYPDVMAAATIRRRNHQGEVNPLKLTESLPTNHAYEP